ncbi:hypothetical protein [Azospira restricta]|uniref:Secreted protein n=1 Tax=Azospira restricta TaxID=404405 RepID=A0A974PX22_9RHOO|nr:hypothetical protein [Azospira restricta]QRJ63062.1 hypothetical protein IWH25_15105 [Azospira restricta]
MKTLLARLLLAASLLPAAAAADPVAPPDGKYRCYQPPEQTVVAWFEIVAGTVRIDGGEPRRFAFDARARRIDWPGAELAPYRHGFFFPVGADDEHGERTTIVLAQQRRARPGQAGWQQLPRCYLTTH